MKELLLIDNYDSFTYNLVHYFEELGVDVTVLRNDKLDLDEIEQYSMIVLSPGPGIPEEAGLLKEIIRRYGPTKKIFGVCLGQQAIGEVYGTSLKNLDRVYHGVATEVKIDTTDPLFKGLNTTIQVGRYHSWVIDNDSNTDAFKIISEDENGQIMAIRHKEYNICSVQFHPESVLTPKGKQLLDNWLKN